jgi:nucleoporin NDC1
MIESNSNDPTVFWTWIPFGRAGIRTGLLFISAFTIFVLRVSQLHVGQRTTNSAFQTFQQYAFSFETIQTTGWYLFSAWLYTEVYIFSSPRTANIGWLTDARNNSLPRLNERPIYLTAYFLMLALVQAGFHLYYDYDCIPLAATKTKPQSNSDQRVILILPPYVQLKSKLPSLVTSAFIRAVTMTMLGPVIYSMTIRQVAWSWTLTFAKVLWSLPRSTSLPAIPPYHWQILGKTFTGGFLLIFSWEVANAAFSVYVAQEPLKNDRPITYESRDPNGSLITGLKGKKLQTRVCTRSDGFLLNINIIQAFAMWELVYIAQRFQGRRKTIFEEIDRKGGSTWSQVLEICLGTINGINTRITEHLAPPPAPAAQVAQQVPGLPRLSAPLKEDNVFTASPPPRSTGASIGAAVGSIAKAHGHSPGGPQTLKLISQAKSKMLTPDHQKALSAEGVWGVFSSYALQVLESPLGRPFRQEFRRRIATIILGSPYGDVGIIVDAIDTLTQLSVCSLSEDPFGNVSRDVPEIIRTFTTVIARLDGFKQSLGVHWTDVEKKRESPEVDIILAALKSGLNELLEAFGDYSVDLRLSQSDMRMAREAATPPAKEKVIEMKQK